MPMNPLNLLSMLLKQRPDLTNNGYVQTIQQNDSQRGEQIANNICASLGMTREQATAKAREFFHL